MVGACWFWPLALSRPPVDAICSESLLRGCFGLRLDDLLAESLLVHGTDVCFVAAAWVLRTAPWVREESSALLAVFLFSFCLQRASEQAESLALANGQIDFPGHKQTASTNISSDSKSGNKLTRCKKQHRSRGSYKARPSPQRLCQPHLCERQCIHHALDAAAPGPRRRCRREGVGRAPIK